jgi:hypothetical protein
MEVLSSTKIRFDWGKMRWEGLTIELIQLWERMYPDVDVVNELKVNMIAWLDRKKGTKIAYKKDWKKTIHNWLKSSQNNRR